VVLKVPGRGTIGADRRQPLPQTCIVEVPNGVRPTQTYSSKQVGSIGASRRPAALTCGVRPT